MKQRQRWLAFWSSIALLLSCAIWISPSAVAGGSLNTAQEEEEEAPKKKVAKPAPANFPELRPTLDLSNGPFNLQEEGRKLQSQYPVAAKLLEEFSKQQDILVSQDAGGQPIKREIRPLAEKYDASDPGPLKYEPVGGNGVKEMPRNLIIAVEHFENRARNQVRAFVQEQSSKPAGAADKMPAFYVHRTADMILGEVERFHAGARERKQRKGDRWIGLDKELQKEVFQHQIAEIDSLKASRDWGNAYALCERMWHDNTGERPLELAIEAVFVAHAESLLNDQQNFLHARLVLKKLQDNYKFAYTAAVRRVEERLKDKALKAFREAQQKKEEGKRTEMLSFLEIAAQAWPETPGLREFFLQERATYPVLQVGVRHLPQQISPTTAATDAEKMAVRLVFEPLVSLRAGPSAKEGYVYKLGDDLRRIDQGYEIVLPESLKWSDGTPIRAADILRSCELATKKGSQLYDIDTATLLEARAPDEQRVELIFKRGVLDPFAYLDFPLVPVKRLPSDRSPRDLAFGKQPLGSGPFMLKSANDEEVVFVVNPHYKRWHAPNGPNLKEIRFNRYDDFSVARKNLEDGRWQMVLDLTTAEMKQITGTDQFAVSTPSAESKGTNSLSNPRVWFLAPNLRNKALANENLRKAIGYGIDRDEVLSRTFGRVGGAPHRIINGPFPFDSWAYDRDTFATRSPFDLDKSAEALKNAKTELGGSVPELTLKYPNEALGAKEACEAIRRQLQSRGINLKVQGVPQATLASELARAEPDFDLVYWCYDFEDERLSVRPMFDTSGLGEDGRNYIGADSSTGLVNYFDRIQTHRDFVYNQKCTYDIHRTVVDKMLLIPLWQLDTHVAWSRKLKFHRMHPLWIFDHVELWSLE